VSGTRRRAITAIGALLCLGALAGCSASSSSGDSGPEPATVRKSVVDVVERSAAAVGGRWKVSSGPSVEACGDGVEDKARYVFIMERSGSTGDQPAEDVKTMKKFWDAEGIATTAYRSGGEDPLLGMRGKGGPILTIAFNAYPERYSITAVSKCADGSVSDLLEDE
jgi:hypothetical protein